MPLQQEPEPQWEERFSKTKNRKYYLNKVTGVTTWVNPCKDSWKYASARSVPAGTHDSERGAQAPGCIACAGALASCMHFLNSKRLGLTLRSCGVHNSSAHSGVSTVSHTPSMMMASLTTAVDNPAAPSPLTQAAGAGVDGLATTPSVYGSSKSVASSAPPLQTDDGNMCSCVRTLVVSSL